MGRLGFIRGAWLFCLVTGMNGLRAEIGSQSILGLTDEPPQMSVSDMISEGIQPPAPTPPPRLPTKEELERFDKEQNWLAGAIQEQEDLKSNTDAVNAEGKKDAEKKKSQLDSNYSLRPLTSEDLLKKAKAPPKVVEDESWRYKPLINPLSDLMSKDTSSSSAVMKTTNAGAHLYQGSSVGKASNVKGYDETLEGSHESVGLNSTGSFLSSGNSTSQPLSLNTVQINAPQGSSIPGLSGWGQAADLLKKSSSKGPAPMTSSAFNDALLQKMQAPQAPVAPMSLGTPGLTLPTLNPAQLQVKTSTLTITAPVPIRTIPNRSHIKTPAEYFGN